jgi:hypothetical protein
MEVTNVTNVSADVDDEDRSVDRSPVNVHHGRRERSSRTPRTSASFASTPMTGVTTAGKPPANVKYEDVNAGNRAERLLEPTCTRRKDGSDVTDHPCGWWPRRVRTSR